MKTCKLCIKEFEGYGKNCGSCRSKLSRKPVAESVATEPVAQYVASISKPVAREGYCHSCGEEVNRLICICLKCVTEGKTHDTIGIKCPDYEETRKPNGTIRG